MKQIYLDYNATTPIASSVIEVMQPFLTEHYGNPSSSHVMGRACAEAVEDARMHVGSLLGVDREEVVFTSGGTESNNLAIVGAMLAAGPPGDGHLIVSSIEHPAVIAPARHLESLGYDVSFVDCDETGVVQPEAIQACFRPDTRLVSIMHANNEIGTVQPLRKIGEICSQNNALFHTDAAQSVGKISTMIDEIGVDMLTIAGHKIYAPKGVGALFVREGVALEPVIHGAGHENGMRPGTENVPYIVALGQACKLATKSTDNAGDRMTLLRDRLANHLEKGVGSELIINGQHAPRLPNTLSVVFPNADANSMLRRIPELCASTGAACHSDSDNYSSTLRALGLSREQAMATIRLSVGWQTSEEEIDHAASLLLDAWENDGV